jgi:hypothetical protein
MADSNSKISQGTFVLMATDAHVAAGGLAATNLIALMYVPITASG